MATIDYGRAGVSAKLDHPFIGIVKKVDDSKRAGRIQVWIPELKSHESDETGWVTCEYCSPFAGVTNFKDTSSTVLDTDQGSQSSYGFFATPPDINNEVVVIFIGGDANRAIYIGCLFGEYMMHQVPAVAASTKSRNTSKAVPVTEYNKNDRSMGGKGTDPTRPWNEARTNGIGGQGLISDNVRGLTSSSAMRESPSSVFGMITPGRKKGKGRTGGHSFVMDDGDATGKDSYIGFRTTTGASIRIDDTNGLIYAINAKGTAWIQMDADGNVDIFGAKSMSVRSREDINLRADKNINMEAGQSINMKAVAGAVNTEAATDVNTKAGANMKLDAATFSVKSGNFNVTSGGDVSATANIAAGAEMFAADFKAPGVGLVGHVHNTSPPPSQAGGKKGPFAGPAVAPIPKTAKTDVNAGFAGTATVTVAGSGVSIPNYWSRETVTLETIVSRLMTYEPCPDHVNKGQ